MRFLIDTHTFLWFSNGDNALSPKVKNLLLNKNNTLLLSIASLWEISIKTSLGKLHISGNYELIMEDVIENDIEILPINFSHTVIQNKLEFHHRDPFDRIIVAQALVEGINLISIDTLFDSYLQGKTVQRLW
jgi:PIN domain nuclease of toxin-antitoxin system